MAEARVVSLEAWAGRRERCARAGCTNRVECWDDEGRLCDACALEHQLFDRDARWAATARTA